MPTLRRPFRRPEETKALLGVARWSDDDLQEDLHANTYYAPPVLDVHHLRPHDTSEASSLGDDKKNKKESPVGVMDRKVFLEDEKVVMVSGSETLRTPTSKIDVQATTLQKEKEQRSNFNAICSVEEPAALRAPSPEQEDASSDLLKTIASSSSTFGLRQAGSQQDARSAVPVSSSGSVVCCSSSTSSLHGKIQVEVVEPAATGLLTVQHHSPHGGMITFEEPEDDGIPLEVELPKIVGDDIMKTQEAHLNTSVDNEDLSFEEVDDDDTKEPLASIKDATLHTGTTVTSHESGETPRAPASSTSVPTTTKKKKKTPWWSRVWRRGRKQPLDSSDIARMVEASLAAEPLQPAARPRLDSPQSSYDIEVASTTDSHELVLLDEQDELWVRRVDPVWHNDTAVL